MTIITNTTQERVLEKLRVLATAKGLYLYEPLAMLDGHRFYLRKIEGGRRTLKTAFSSNDLKEIAVFLAGEIPAFMAGYKEPQTGGFCNEIPLGTGESRPCVLSTCDFGAFQGFSAK